jgi:hypothetical protein
MACPTEEQSEGPARLGLLELISPQEAVAVGLVSEVEELDQICALADAALPLQAG